MSALRRRPSALIAIGFLVVLVVACVFAGLVAPHGPNDQELSNVLSGPTAHNWLGTDTLGRDVLSRLLYGGRRSLLSVLEGLAVVMALGVPLGLAAGYLGGRADRVLSRTAEIVMAIPAIIFILVVLAVRPHDEDIAMVAFGVLGAPAVLRVVRGATLVVRQELYVTAAQVSGLTQTRVVVRHVLPRVRGPIVVQATMFASYALLFETGLAYLGLTGEGTKPTWGGMVAEASTVLQQQEWLLFPSGCTIALTILALGLVGDAVRDVSVRDVASAPRRRRRRSVRAPRAQEVQTIRTGSSAGARADALLRVEGLSVALTEPAPGRTLVDGVSFDVAPGETVGLVGESGCGKTVTALSILRLLAPGVAPTGGRVVYEDRDLLALDDRAFDRLRGASLAYISQEPQSSLDPTFTIGSQLAEVVRHHDGGSRAAARTRALELLELVQLPQPERVARAHAHELSGGMAQRVAIALALAGRPQLLIADEPTTALDVTVQAEILALLREVQAETGMALLVITHNWGVVADLCDRTVVMYAGQVVEEAAVQALFDRPLHPYTRGLLESHPSYAEPGRALAVMAGRVPPPGEWPTGCRFAARCPLAAPECVAQATIPLLDVDDDHVSRCVRVEQLAEKVGA